MKWERQTESRRAKVVKYEERNGGDSKTVSGGHLLAPPPERCLCGI